MRVQKETKKLQRLTNQDLRKNSIYSELQPELKTIYSVDHQKMRKSC